MKRLAIITTHPIQYYAPLFRLMSARGKIGIRVFYTWKGQERQFEPDFGTTIQWDIPLLDGYDHEFVSNTSKRPGSHSFNGIANPTLIPAIRAFEPHAIFVFGWAYRSHLQVLRHFHGSVPVFFRGDSTLLDVRGDLKQWVRRNVLRWVYKHVDKAFYVGKENKRYYEYCGLSEDQLVFAPHAIDNDRFMDDGAGQGSALRKTLGISSEELVILFAGKFIPKKDPLLLLEAYKSLAPEVKRYVSLVFVGDGTLGSELRHRAAQSKVFFVPFQNQSMLPGTYRAGDLFCLPSQGPGETWGLAANEAMACGLPVIVSSKTGCGPDLVTEDTGWSFESGNKEQLVAVLTKALADRSSLKRRGACAQDHIRSFSFEKISSVVEEEVGNL